jgi:hypothetical protein
MSSSGKHRGWQETKLWVELSQRSEAEAVDVRLTLERVMPDIEAVLFQGGTSPLDFTLHDAGHSFRVSDRIHQLIPADVLPKLHVYELALLLLSAYLHDIGMTPERHKVSGHYDFLLTGERGSLSQTETDCFQTWLDDEGEGIVPPLSSAQPTADILHRAEQIITYYCRFKHNDWSEDWIRSHLHKLMLGTYVTWLDDLVVLCRSHHEGYLELAEQSRFDSKIVGNPGRPINPRYLAMLLRAADVLEFDPERTPEVLLRHRNVSRRSEVFWWKDHQISFVINENRVLISARPNDARMHRAIEQTIDQVETELRVCKALADGVGFQRCAGIQSSLPYRWDLSPTVFQDVQPRHSSYEYIDGSFRPDTQKLLAILSGTELYGSSFVAVRELLQNAFDAVKEQIARERLAQPSPSSGELEEVVQRLHGVDLRLEVRDGAIVLICQDTGVGMTKAIIRDHMLVSGSARRHDVLDLERRCRAEGFSVGRTGQFGIGVLSYFMLASKVRVVTKRSQEAGDAEPTGWAFETEGVGSFGELRKANKARHGTEITLYVKPEVIRNGLGQWYEELTNYINDLVSRVPCNFSVSCSLPNSVPLARSPGWVWSRDDVVDSVVKSVRKPYSRDSGTPVELLPSKRREEMKERTREWSTVLGEFGSALDFRTMEASLPDGAGTFRIHLCYFKLPSGRCLKFLRLKEKIVSRTDWGFSLNMSIPMRISWKGMRTPIGPPHKDAKARSELFDRHHVPSSKIALIEMDLTDARAGSVSVSRNVLDITSVGQEYFRWVVARSEELAGQFAEENLDSSYAWLDSKALDLNQNGGIPRNVSWLSTSYGFGNGSVIWDRCSFPLTTAKLAPYRCEWGQRWRILWKDTAVTVLPSLGSDTSDREPGSGDPWNSRAFPPDRVVVMRVNWFPGMSVVPLWTQTPTKRESDSAILSCAFPSSWRHVSSVRFKWALADLDDFVVWNPENWLFALIDQSSVAWVRKNVSATLDPLPIKEALLSSPSYAAAWIVLCIESQKWDLWDGLKDRDSSFLVSLWGVLRPVPGEPDVGRTEKILQWISSGNESTFHELSPNGWFSSRSGLESFLHELRPEFTLLFRQ